LNEDQPNQEGAGFNQEGAGSNQEGSGFGQDQGVEPVGERVEWIRKK
jgi:hypothetical protein